MNLKKESFFWTRKSSWIFLIFYYIMTKYQAHFNKISVKLYYRDSSSFETTNHFVPNRPKLPVTFTERWWLLYQGLFWHYFSIQNNWPLFLFEKHFAIKQIRIIFNQYIPEDPAFSTPDFGHFYFFLGLYI